MTVNVGGKTFTYVKPTIRFIRRIQPKNYDALFTNESIMGSISSDESFKAFSKKWREFCNDIFEKNFLWRLGFFPKELKYGNLIVPSGMTEVVQGFFGLLLATQSAPAEQGKPSEGSGSKGE